MRAPFRFDSIFESILWPAPCAPHTRASSELRARIASAQQRNGDGDGDGGDEHAQDGHSDGDGARRRGIAPWSRGRIRVGVAGLAVGAITGGQPARRTSGTALGASRKVRLLPESVGSAALTLAVWPRAPSIKPSNTTQCIATHYATNPLSSKQRGSQQERNNASDARRNSAALPGKPRHRQSAEPH